MTVIESLSAPLVFPRDDLTIPQFFLDHPDGHFTRPTRSDNVPCIVDELSGKVFYLNEVRHHRLGDWMSFNRPHVAEEQN